MDLGSLVDEVGQGVVHPCMAVGAEGADEVDDGYAEQGREVFRVAVVAFRLDRYGCVVCGSGADLVVEAQDASPVGPTVGPTVVLAGGPVVVVTVG